MIVTFCGHSNFCKSEKHEKIVLDILYKHIGERKAEAYLGGYGNFDDFAFGCVKKYQQNHSNISLVYVTPYLSEYQHKNLRYQEERYDSILYPEIEGKPLKFAIYYRNRYMVEKADIIIAYISREWGGAYKAYKYAKSKGKVVFNIAEK